MLARAARRPHWARLGGLRVQRRWARDDFSAEAAAWQRTYAATSRDELLAAYAEWAPSYDVDALERFGYAAPEAMADVLARHLDDRGSPILDAGAGTGILGKALAARGFTQLTGVDACAPMLERARAKRCYASLLEADLCDANAAPRELRGTFAAVACVGTVTYNHIDAGAAVGAWRQWLRPRGLLCLAVRDDFWRDDAAAGAAGVAATCAALEANGTWALVEARAPHAPPPPRAARRARDSRS